MKKIPIAYSWYVNREAPEFARSIRLMKRRNARKVKAGQQPEMLVTTLETFREDVALLYACLWYAESAGVPVLFAPREASE